ncbi:MAG: hypothetical protein OXG56_02410 [Gammaproteobacteria bacterium]|nr:hypothetical protein [Gammaproteobacteria bacterium]
MAKGQIAKLNPNYSKSEDMNGLSTQGSLELQVTNFGPIINARVDLRPLTVSVGPSNTGKSYMAILIYALHQYFGGSTKKDHIGFFRGPRMKERKPSRNLPDGLNSFRNTVKSGQIQNMLLCPIWQ